MYEEPAMERIAATEGAIVSVTLAALEVAMPMAVDGRIAAIQLCEQKMSLSLTVVFPSDTKKARRMEYRDFSSFTRERAEQ